MKHGTRPYNFSAGPAALPTSVLEKIESELFNWKNTGASVMEVSHRGKEFVALGEKIQTDLRRILNIPKNYHILLLHGGARAQFAMIPMNLLATRKPTATLKAAYAVTGHWSHLAAEEAESFCVVNSVIEESATKEFTTIPDSRTWKIDDDAAYLYYCENETIHGLEFKSVPSVSDLPLVCDMSSSLLSHPFDVSQFGLVYACAQKNLGIAGVTVVIVREDLIGNVLPNTPSIMNYQLAVNKESMLNTPSTFAWYVLGLMLEWVDAQGGLTAVAEHNARKAKKLYDFIDQSGFYTNPVDRQCRSDMSVIFYLPDEKMNADFLKGAAEHHLIGLKGHREIGGMRASIYNAMGEAGVDALIAFMKSFIC